MLEARLQEAGTLKRLLDAIKELVTDANFECSEEGINLQAMDNSHVALVAVKMQPEAFEKYRCDRPMPLGVNLTSLTKVLKCAKDDDTCTLKAGDDGDVLGLLYEAKASDRIAEYEMKLMDIDTDTLGIPDTEYDASVTMPSAEFTRIVRDLSLLGESVRIEVNKEGVRFASEGEAANGNVLLKMTEAARQRWEDYDKDEEASGSAVKKEEGDEEGEGAKKGNVKKEVTDDDVVMVDDDDEDGEEEQEVKDDDDDDDEEETDEKRKKRKAGKQGKSSQPPKKPRTKKADGDGGDKGGVYIQLDQHVSLTFSLKYLVNFSKSATLSDTVMLMMSNDVPLLVKYKFGGGSICYYLAPKIGDD
ncbi:proliferating cell nuclear antigen, N-terminal domain-containing protein [Pterulicium gracile]|uniref:DNA sliding clamp PCNA n=1 Tax=Pterulicium gracile TaxID=1884261 RepID=A0A5C3QG75_9AGAR|nr:proliferating cell nuclear antigen, N-terminal domain-containing protein [Pterula gracilis]